MKRNLFLILTIGLVIAATMTVYAQQYDHAQGTTFAVRSNFAPPGKAHTHLFIFIPESGSQLSIPAGETPASIACVYGLVAPTSGCPKSGTLLPTGGTKAVILVDYGRYAGLQSDLNAFNIQWGYPPVTLNEICSGGPPPCPDNTNTGWDVEEALDIEWAHAMAPNAALYLSEWTNDPLADGAEDAASQVAIAAGGGEVSNSWTYVGGEFSGETGLDTYFQHNTVVYFGAAGDGGLGPEYPSISPFVISAGGTHINRSSGNFTGTEACWTGSGGGISIFEPRPNYQNIPKVKTIVGNFRGTPDISADADPGSGVAFYVHGSWGIVGGTSVASPVLAGYVNSAGNFLSSTNAELYKTYYIDSSTAVGWWYPPFFDITTTSSRAKIGWDNCTGIGSPRKLSGF